MDRSMRILHLIQVGSRCTGGGSGACAGTGYNVMRRVSIPILIPGYCCGCWVLDVCNNLCLVA